jgi:hypothetical protein
MSNQLSVFNKDVFTMSVSKAGVVKTGSIALVIAKGSSASRASLSYGIYQEQIANGMYRPAARDIVKELVAKSAQPYLSVAVDGSGPMKKADFIALCTQVDYVVRNSGKELKGTKAFVYDIVKQVVQSVVKAEGTGEVVA